MKKILIVKIGAIGDVALSLPLLSQIKEDEPHSQITWIIGKSAAPLIHATKRIDCIIEISEKALLEGNMLQKAFCLFKVWLKLFGKRFDTIITAHADPRYLLFSLFCRAKKRARFHRLFSRRFPIPGRYHAHEYLRLWGKGMIKWPPLTLPEKQFQKGQYVLFPGGERNGGKALRRWPLENYIFLAERLLKAGFSVTLIGGENDDGSAFTHLDVRDYRGKLSLLETLVLLKNAKLLIAHDSGPLHLAKLVQTPTLGLFGPTNPKEFMPYPHRDVLWGGENLPCSPCYDGKTYAACSNAICMRQLDVDMVFQKAMILSQ